MKKTLALALALLLCALPLSGCSWFMKDSSMPDDLENPVVTLEMEDGGVVTMELYPRLAPNTVANFVTLVEDGFYDGLIFHRVISGFMVQGGDPTGTGMGGPDYEIKGEFSANGVNGNDLSHARGVLSMARAQSFDSAGSQFFIMHGDSPSLDGQYAAFGKVTSGIEVIDQIAATPVDASDRPLVEQKIKKITVDPKGYDYSVVKIEH